MHFGIGGGGVIFQQPIPPVFRYAPKSETRTRLRNVDARRKKFAIKFLTSGGKVGHAAEINAYQRVAGEAIFEIGKRLKHVKENDLAHGEWSKWCDSIGVDRSNANKFIRIYDELSKSNVVTSPRLGMDALYLIAQIPEEQREQPHTIPSTGETKLFSLTR
ncbi:DUF3102 domain-containing protein [Bacillus sp. DNRA2]|nr:DUF3102 domain-containing protein [Bacillus sp. DNRA2]